jgi:hypothetical protein
MLKIPYKFKKSYGGTPEPQTPQDAPWLHEPSLKIYATLITRTRALVSARAGGHRAALTLLILGGMTYSSPTWLGPKEPSNPLFENFILKKKS